MKTIIKLAVTDFKIIFRDPTLKAMLFLPIILFAFFILFLPYLVNKYYFLNAYLTIFIIIGVIENTQAFCFINTMVLLDEKESGVAKTYGILPLNSATYLFSRFLIPFLFTTLINVLFLILQPFYSIGIGYNILISLLAALIIPLYVLGINSIATSRMQGMIYIKAFNMLVLIPVAAFFIPQSFKHIFGFLPTHWVYQTIYNVTNQQSVVVTSILSVLFLVVLTVLVSKKFMKKHFT